VSQTYGLLRSLRDNAQLLKVLTPMWDYENMILTRVELPRTSTDGDSGKFSISLKQIRQVETRRTTQPIPTEVRGQKAKIKGAKGPVTPANARSVSLAIAQKVGGVLGTDLGGLLAP
jgi:hypothetical protein